MGETGLLRFVAKFLLHSGFMYSYYHFCTEYIFEIGICAGKSMEPTLFDNDLIIINKINRYSVEKDDLVITRSPSDPSKYLCKRVVHVPGDIISFGIYSKQVYRGTIWLQGDNLPNSNDSRDYGPVPLGLIIGKPILKIWPSIKYLKKARNFMW